MLSAPQRHELASDNTSGICPEAMAAWQAANSGAVASYGDDGWTAKLHDKVREIFETDCDVHAVFNGTAANAIALSHMCRPYHSILCHERAHVQTDECGAPEFFSGGAKLLLLGGPSGKIDLEDAAEMIARQPVLHAQKPKVLSITQATELGTVYTGEEIQKMGEFARAHEMYFHMDGARFANAVASLGCEAKEITWQAGVDALCFGGTKNGLGMGELLIVFRPELAEQLDYRIKQAGQLGSKSRFLAAPWLELLGSGAWLKNAARANAAAQKLARLLRELGFEPVFPVEANSVFVRLERSVADSLEQRGWHFYRFIEPDIYRLMCGWAVEDEMLEDFLADLRAVRPSHDP